MPFFQYQEEEKQICQEILRLKARLSELAIKKRQLGQTPLDVARREERGAAHLSQQDFFLPAELAQELGWNELDLLHFELDAEQNLHIRRVELEDEQYTMIFDQDFSTVLPYSVLRQIFPNLDSEEDVGYLPEVEFHAEIQDGELLIRHK